MEQQNTTNLQSLIGSFLVKFNENVQIKDLLQDWNRIFRVSLTDLNMNIDLLIENNSIGMAGQATDYPLIGFSGKSEVIQAVFSGNENPAIALAMGELSIQGDEKDIMKLQVIASELWN